MAKKQHYFDYAATTPIDPKVLSAMLPFLKQKFGNPSNLYKLGRESGKAVSEAAKIISDSIECKTDEIVFTSSATEADNLAILGAARANFGSPLQNTAAYRKKIIVSSVEHKGILAACKALEKEGFEIVRLPVKKDGLVDLEFLKNSLDERTILVSVTMADSETGTIQPIAEIADIIKKFREEPENSKFKKRDLSAAFCNFEFSGSQRNFPYFHTDASQAAGYLDLNVNKLGVDLMTISAHKISGPKGIGCLFVRNGVKINPLVYGGGQNHLRSGTENVPGIIGFAEAMRLNKKNKKAEAARIKKLRDALEKGIFKSIPKVVLNGHQEKRLPNFLNISILDVEGEALLLYLDELGIMVATGSACNSQSLEPSYILSALGRPYEHIHGSIRFSLGKGNNMNDVKAVLRVLPKVVKRLREISPLNLKANQTKKISDPKVFIGNQTPHFIKKKTSN